MERIQDEVGRAGLSESYFESGPQSVTQLVISFSRGYEMEKNQDASIFVVSRSVRCVDHFRSGCIGAESLMGIFPRLLHRENSRPGQSFFSIISSLVFSGVTRNLPIIPCHSVYKTSISDKISVRAIQDSPISSFGSSPPQADPDPALNMVGIWVYPCMLVVAVNSMMMWTLKGGILGRATIRI